MTMARLIASGGGVGYAPRAPGTFGSLLGLLLGAALLALGHLPLLAGILAASAAGIWAVQATGSGYGDPGWVVIDEIAGQMIAMFAMPRLSLAGMLLSLLLFRFFDISKLGPIGRAGGRRDAWGVMADDWLAGLFAALAFVLLVLITRTPRGWSVWP